MIPLFRSLTELIAITESSDQKSKGYKEDNILSLIGNSEQDRNYISIKDKKIISLPSLPKQTRKNWIKSKKAVSKFFDELDYNNQIQSSYDLTLQARQSNLNNQDVA